jgi:hypothetical protein
MAYLGGSQPQIAIPLSESQIMRVSTRPLTFESKITCKPLSKLEEATDDADLDDDDTEIDEDNADSSEARF